MRICVIGGGILGLAVTRNLLLRGYKDVTLIEKDNQVASHQSSRNSGVMHAGLYYQPGSLKASLSRKGIVMMKEYCTQKNIPFEECGKIVVSTSSEEQERLQNLYTRGLSNGLKDIQLLTKDQALKIEPNVNVDEAILVPEESIVSYKQVANSYLADIREFGCNLVMNSPAVPIESSDSSCSVLVNNESCHFDFVISCTGLYGDIVAKQAGVSIQNSKIIPFRGEYFKLKPQYSKIVNNLIYPVPNPEMPFLGVHFTRMINNEVEAGPNAILALSREGYDWTKINLSEFIDSITYEGLMRFISKYPAITAGEVLRSLSKPIFVNSLRRLIPNITSSMIEPAPAGVRAQLLNPDGSLEQDFKICSKGVFCSILNAPSPAATSSLAIADYVLDLLNMDG